MGHIKMMAAVQPFLSGAISKTVNMPTDATPDDIQQAYLEGWKLGLKAIAVYRDGCKRSQPLSAGKGKEEAAGAKVISIEEARPRRVKLPDERVARTHKFSIAGHEGYLTVGLYDDGDPGEIFLKMAKEGSTVSGLMDTIATMTSIALQYGVPLKALVDKFSHTRFEPSGFTNNSEIPFAKSIADYVFRYLGSRYLRGEEPVPDEQETQADVVGLGDAARPALRAVVAGGSGASHSAAAPGYAIVNQADAPSCSECGSIMVRNGACYKCANCGGTSGCS
jgi:ribonucleoside-diphosphate reductase alpha chain